MKRKNKCLLLILVLLIILFGIKVPTKADSGWDSSYDSGGSSFGGSSHHDWGSSDYDSSNEHFVAGDIFGIVIFILLFNLIAWLGIKFNTEGNFRKKIDRNLLVDINDDEFKSVVKGISMDKLKQKAFDIYKDIQYAWSNFDYDKLKLLTTDEIFNMYSSQLNTLEIKNQQNVMKDITKEDVKIVSAKEENGIITIESYLKVNCYDYVIDKKTNKVLRGTDKNKLEIEYLITLVKDVNSDNDNITKCPSCGAEVKMTARGKCSYCKSVLVQKPSDYVMSKKECIGQRVLMEMNRGKVNEKKK